jgi:hypothetical protein
MNLIGLIPFIFSTFDHLSKHINIYAMKLSHSIFHKFIFILFVLGFMNEGMAQKSFAVSKEYDFQNSQQLFGKSGQLFTLNSSVNINTTLEKELISLPYTIPIIEKTPFITLAAKITADGIWLEDFVISYRLSKDSMLWTDWETFSLDSHAHEFDHENHEADDKISTLLFLEDNASYFQYKVDLKTENANIHKLRFDFFNPGIGIETKDHQPKNIIEPRQMDCPTLDFKTRVDWGCPDGLNAPLWEPQYSKITHFVIHHQAGIANPPYDAVLRSIWNYHTNTNGWGDIGYNWIVAPDGTIYQGRAWVGQTDQNVRGAHMCACNGNKAGICLLGNFTNSFPTQNAYSTLIRLLGWKATELLIEPLDQSLTPIRLSAGCADLVANHIIGHMDGCPMGYTECPGAKFAPAMSQIKTDVANLIDQCVAPCNKPLNDGCGAGTLATNLLYTENYSPIKGNTCGATSSLFPSCVGYQDDDVFYRFTPTTDHATIRIKSGIGNDIAFQLLSGPCNNAMVELSCINETGYGGIESYFADNLTSGVEYFIRVWHIGFANGTDSDFDIGVYNSCVNVNPTPLDITGTPIGFTDSISIFNIINQEDVAYKWEVLSGGIVSGSNDKSSLFVRWTSAGTHTIKVSVLTNCDSLLYTDIYTVNVTTLSSTLDDFFVKSNITIFPNPTKNLFTIRLGNDAEILKDVQISIYDMMQREVYVQNKSKYTQNQGIEIDATSWIKGTYLVNVLVNNEVSTHKVVIK